MRPLRAAIAATTLHVLIAVAMISPWFFRFDVATAQRIFGASNGEKALFEDVHAYFLYADRAVRGEVPYRDYLVEYPIAAFPLFYLPRLFAATFEGYRVAFAVEMLGFDFLAVWLVARRASERGRIIPALTWYTLGFAALGPLTTSRFDLAPTSLAFAAFLAGVSGRRVLGGFLAGVGGLMKLFPAVVVGPWVVSDRPGQVVRAVGSLIVTILVCLLVWGWLGGSGMVESLRYHVGRGLEIESLYAGILIVAAQLRGSPLATDFNHSSVELIASGARFWANLATPIQAVAIGLAIGRSRRAASADAPRWGIACVLGFALFGKVLSPQYVLWLLPFMASLEGPAGRWGRPTYLAAAGLTTLVYPWSGGGLMRFAPLAVGLLNLRNLALLVVFGITLFAPTSERG